MVINSRFNVYVNRGIFCLLIFFSTVQLLLVLFLRKKNLQYIACELTLTMPLQSQPTPKCIRLLRKSCCVQASQSQGLSVCISAAIKPFSVVYVDTAVVTFAMICVVFVCRISSRDKFLVLYHREHTNNWKKKSGIHNRSFVKFDTHRIYRW